MSAPRDESVVDLFRRLCEIPSPSREEGAVADEVRGMLAALGAEIGEDDAARRIGSGCNNIIGRFPATAEGGVPIAFISHLDTVPNRAPIEVVEVDGMLTNANAAILGGDNKSAVAATLHALARVVDRGTPHAGVELVFTPCEEIGLRGAAALDPALLRAEMGFVFDHTGPMGRVVTRAPSLRKIEATFVGTPAHAGIVPEQGRSAIGAAAAAIDRMPLGRIDSETTANVGTISGGTATNVISERCTLLAEARGVSDARLSAQLTAMMDALTWAASEREVDVEVAVDREFDAYSLGESEPQVAMATEVLRDLGYPVEFVVSGGGSDANALLKNGFPAVNLCNEMIDIHTDNERIAPQTLDRLVEVTEALIARARDA